MQNSDILLLKKEFSVLMNKTESYLDQLQKVLLVLENIDAKESKQLGLFEGVKNDSEGRSISGSTVGFRP